jgi:hypothetical protein
MLNIWYSHDHCVGSCVCIKLTWMIDIGINNFLIGPLNKYIKWTCKFAQSINLLFCNYTINCEKLSNGLKQICDWIQR